jgi:hypothetical protein
LDKWYTKLVGAMFEAIPRNAAEHHRTPQEVVKMGKLILIHKIVL